MATKTFDELKQLAIQIRDEKTNKQNTANRVGTAMLEGINKLEQDYYDKIATDEELKERDEKLTELEGKTTIVSINRNYNDGDLTIPFEISVNDSLRIKLQCSDNNGKYMLQLYNDSAYSENLFSSSTNMYDGTVTVKKSANRLKIQKVAGETDGTVKVVIERSIIQYEDNKKDIVNINNKIGFKKEGTAEFSSSETSDIILDSAITEEQTIKLYIRSNIDVDSITVQLYKDGTWGGNAYFGPLKEGYNEIDIPIDFSKVDEVNKIRLKHSIDSSIILKYSLYAGLYITEGNSSQLEDFNKFVGSEYAGNVDYSSATSFDVETGDLKNGENLNVYIESSKEYNNFTIQAYSDNAWKSNLFNGILYKGRNYYEITVSKDGVNKIRFLIQSNEIGGSISYRIGISQLQKNTSKLYSFPKIDFNLLLDVDTNPLGLIKREFGFMAILKDMGYIGDSMMSGEVYAENSSGAIVKIDTYDASWAQCICRAYGTKANNYSIGGLTAKTWIDQFWDGNANSYATGDEVGTRTSPSIHDSIKNAYFIGIGGNDAGKINTGEMTLGTIDDIKDNYEENLDTFYGNYGGIIQRLRTLKGNSRIFLCTVSSIYNGNATRKGVNDAIREIYNKFSNDKVYLLDVERLIPSSIQTAIREKYIYQNHFTTLGFQWYSWVITNYIDYIISVH